MSLTTEKTDANTMLHDWVNQYSDALYSWALHKTSDKETAEDLVQETFLAATRAFNKFENKSNAKTWLLSILNNKIIDHYRKQFRNPLVRATSQIEKNASDLLDNFFNEYGEWTQEQRPQEWKEEENLLDNSVFNQTLAGCMKKLPSNWFSALQMKYMEEKSGELICQELQITPTNFWQILHRSKLQLRKCLEINWFAR